jgi:hypothetical protein
MRIDRLESRLPLLAALIAVILLAIAAPASANVGEKIIERCTHGQSLAGFSQSDYREALKELNADTEEYSSCASLIRQAQEAAAGAGGGGGGGGGTTGSAAATPIAASPSEQQAITHAVNAAAEPVKLGDQVIHPGVVHANIASAFSSLPTPLLVTFAFLLACLLAVVGGVLRKRIRVGSSD